MINNKDKIMIHTTKTLFIATCLLATAASYTMDNNQENGKRKNPFGDENEKSLKTLKYNEVKRFSLEEILEILIDIHNGTTNECPKCESYTTNSNKKSLIEHVLRHFHDEARTEYTIKYGKSHLKMNSKLENLIKEREQNQLQNNSIHEESTISEEEKNAFLKGFFVLCNGLKKSDLSDQNDKEITISKTKNTKIKKYSEADVFTALAKLQENTIQYCTICNKYKDTGKFISQNVEDHIARHLTQENQEKYFDSNNSRHRYIHKLNNIGKEMLKKYLAIENNENLE